METSTFLQWHREWHVITHMFTQISTFSTRKSGAICLVLEQEFHSQIRCYTVYHGCLEKHVQTFLNQAWSMAFALIPIHKGQSDLNRLTAHWSLKNYEVLEFNHGLDVKILKEIPNKKF